MRKFLRAVCFLSSALAVAVFIFAYYIGNLLPNTFLVAKDVELKVAGMPFLTMKASEQDTRVSAQSGNSYNIELSIGGIIPVKTARALNVERRVVSVCGTPFGIKMFANGAMVVGFSDIYTSMGYENPAKTAGLRMGDVVISIAGKDTKTNEDVSEALQKVRGAPAEVVFMRDGKEKRVKLTAVSDLTTNTWRTGMWVRDSSAGIGILSFVDNENGVFAGLGHSIHDTDTGETVSLRKGEIVDVEITGCEAGAQGKPGELKGRFISPLAMGDIVLNGETGVYGKMYGYVKGTNMEVAMPQEIVAGKAEIFTTISGKTPKLYAVEIEKIDIGSTQTNRNMVVHITDPRLLSETGGIVQGMSGSPIIQSGYLIGAVTHVLINDPTRGYGIFAEKMLASSDNVVRSKKAA
ncbi:MAG: SpoIVB peptidase [Oscillospiraceae bacterium]